MTTMMFTSNRAGGIIVAESSGLAFPKTPDSVIRVSDFVRAAGLGYGATVVLNELQNQQTLELETLLSNKGAV
ncbi:hypothetical protein CP10881SC42_0032 [Chlamydia avium]|nr:hypothetical protein CP10881SC42_0032 [Chlamydia avium]